MALAFQSPIETLRSSNPATELATQTNPEVLGFTAPHLNGEIMLQRAQLPPPRDLSGPEIETINGAFGWQARVRKPPFNTVSWKIELPPRPVNGVWTASRPVPAGLLRPPLARVPGIDLQKLPSTGDFTLVLRPLPDADSFYKHIVWHEYQHVADHRWLAREIIGPWDEWYTIAHEKGLRFQRSSMADAINATRLTQYAESTIRIARYWQAALYDSGNLYHKPGLGDYPVGADFPKGGSADCRPGGK